MPRRRVWARALALAAALLVASFLASWLKHHNTTFSIRADTQVVDMDLRCGDRVVWDLPPGDFMGDDGTATRTDLASVTLRGGAHARIALDSERRLTVRWRNSEFHRCPESRMDTIRVTGDDGENVVADSMLHYRSAEPVAAHFPPLIVSGRIRLGEEIVEGGGFRGASLPMLLSATVEARTPDALTGQKRLIHTEHVDAGSVVDTHACLDASEGELERCVTASRARASGFIHLGQPLDATGLQAQVSVMGTAVGVRQFGSVERKVSITRWATLITTSWLQVLVAMILALSAIVQIRGAIDPSKKSN